MGVAREGYSWRKNIIIIIKDVEKDIWITAG